MLNINVATSVTEILSASARDEQQILIQNQSDTTMRFAFGAANIALLTSSLGVQLEAGESLVVNGAQASKGVSAIHGGTGSKIAHVQRV